MKAADFYMAVVDKPRVIKRLLRKYWMFKVLQILLALGFVVIAFIGGRTFESGGDPIEDVGVGIWLLLEVAIYLTFPMLLWNSKAEDLRLDLSKLGYEPDNR